MRQHHLRFTSPQSDTPAEAARLWTQGQFIMWYARLLPSSCWQWPQKDGTLQLALVHSSCRQLLEKHNST